MRSGFAATNNPRNRFTLIAYGKNPLKPCVSVPSFPVCRVVLNLWWPCTASMRVTHVESKQQWDELLEEKKSTPVGPHKPNTVNNLREVASAVALVRPGKLIAVCSRADDHSFLQIVVDFTATWCEYHDSCSRFSRITVTTFGFISALSRVSLDPRETLKWSLLLQVWALPHDRSRV